ncbi:MAG: bifunctional alpha,alpha-trehalose-phosphate synthase (UDP-forming)/trehalose-phosphatase, partial [Bacteroidales bacterium]|nr:bifunctional alpha,alpha-trehalose-phosphate synthase (UDP-forming)/trehalose-phosphatase [Bacteroidales bacterium]
MKRVIIVSNRLPVNITIESNKLYVVPSVGGLATGMKSVSENYDSLWIGWPGINIDQISEKQKNEIDDILLGYRCKPVYLDQTDYEDYYEGFSNRTIWPLYHYFMQYVEYENRFWDAYQKVNALFAKIVIENLKEGDIIWIHDYHLQLVPDMIKKIKPEYLIGFFLHIPFPSFEILRTLPWRDEIVNGLLGADLIGFHTFDYERHFLSSVRRLFGYDISFNLITVDNRIIKADSFPMGIDYERFRDYAIEQGLRQNKEKSPMQQDLENHLKLVPGRKLVLSIDRLDYTKGIAQRLQAFEYFFEKYPEYIGKISLFMICVPSRTNVDQYQKMKSEVDELVGYINGKYSTINWTPVWYFYRSFSFEDLVELYITGDIALITPIRDGMNLVAKEYIACRPKKKGVLILSEMAGVAKEMSEALIINPNCFDDIADAIKQAVEMPENEQIERNIIMQDRLKRYNINKWANSFLQAISSVEARRNLLLSKKMNSDIENLVINNYKQAKKRIIFLDYDGTLVGFKSKPEQAFPDDELFNLLDILSKDPLNKLVLISGRDKGSLNNWFNSRKYTLIAEHGVWIKKIGQEWELIEPLDNEWKETVRPGIEMYVDNIPGSFIEEKNYSLVWHFRKADPELGARGAIELKDELTSFTANLNLEILEGNKVIEIKNSGVNKGKAALKVIGRDKYDFIMGIGDDWTDEYMFEQLPSEALTIKVGISNTWARYNVENV